jgi:hypothetical protein
LAVNAPERFLQITRRCAFQAGNENAVAVGEIANPFNKIVKLWMIVTTLTVTFAGQHRFVSEIGC